MTTPNQLPPLPEPDSYQFQHDETGQTMFVDRQQVEWGFEANNPRLHKIGGAFTADQMHAYALAALAQQAQEPVAAALGDIVALWDKYAPSEYMMAIHMQAKRALAGQQPVSPDMHGWCAYVGGMVACWIKSEPDAHARLGDDKFDAAIAGIIERRLWAMPKRDTTPPSPQVPAPPLAASAEDMTVYDGIAKRYFSDTQPAPSPQPAYTPNTNLPPKGENVTKEASATQSYGSPGLQATSIGPKCRDCADFGPICPNSGNPCDSQQSAVPVLSEDDLVVCLISSGCVGTVKMSFESGPMSITRPSLNATKFARAILALRPAVEPMTQEGVDAKCLTIVGHLLSRRERDSIVWRMAEAHYGITAKADGDPNAKS